MPSQVHRSSSGFRRSSRVKEHSGFLAQAIAETRSPVERPEELPIRQPRPRGASPNEAVPLTRPTRTVGRWNPAK